ncbi:MAG: hypothetical protein WCJ70_02670 [bacterium]
MREYISQSKQKLPIGEVHAVANPEKSFDSIPVHMLDMIVQTTYQGTIVKLPTAAEIAANQKNI